MELSGQRIASFAPAPDAHHARLAANVDRPTIIASLEPSRRIDICKYNCLQPSRCHAAEVPWRYFLFTSIALGEYAQRFMTNEARQKNTV